jgi:16S rRNA (adenine1518-N6/adenine1519-N6)-dimethyltransferase
VIGKHGLGARKSLGQHFLLDLNLTRKIAASAGDLSGMAVFEVGPGPGGLTRALLGTAAREVIAVERDRRCIEALEQLVTGSSGRLRLLEADALGTDFTTLAGPPRAVVANLPYNIATPLLLAWLRQIASYDRLVLMFQKEVADRLVAPPRTKAYGRLSVITQWLAEPRLLFDLPPSAFTPPPAVVSSVVRLTPRPSVDPELSFETMERVTAAAFGQRRKMLRASLRVLQPDPEPLLRAAGLSPTARAEEIPVEGFAALGRAWKRVSLHAGGA